MLLSWLFFTLDELTFEGIKEKDTTGNNDKKDNIFKLVPNLFFINLIY